MSISRILPGPSSVSSRKTRLFSKRSRAIFTETENRIEKIVRKEFPELIGSGLCLAVSGGADSVAMLLIFNALKERLSIDISVRHFEHGIRGEESLRDARFVENLCRDLGIPFFMGRGNVLERAKEAGLSTEEAARNLRYEYLCEAPETYIATAHNAMDNAETILFNLVRGSGIGGLTGISGKRTHLGKTIIRPILDLNRQEILSYLKEKGQNYCEDRTNEELLYSRNRIRKEVIPSLLKVNERAVEHINNAGKSISFYREYENDIAEKVLSGRSDSLDIDSLKEYPEEIKELIIFKFITGYCGARDITRAHVKGVLGLLNSETGKQVDIPGHVVKRVYNKLCIENKNKEPEGSYNTEYEEVKREIIDLKNNPDKKSDILGGNYPKDRYTKWLDYDKMGDNCCYRTPREGDYLTIKGPDGRPVKKYFNRYCIDAKIPREKRAGIKLLCSGSHIVWILGDRISEEFKVGEHTKTLIIIKVKEKGCV